MNPRPTIRTYCAKIPNPVIREDSMSQTCHSRRLLRKLTPCRHIPTPYVFLTFVGWCLNRKL